MSAKAYARGLAALGITLALLMVGASGWLIVTANRWASDDLHVGHGHSGFPPQSAPRLPAPETGGQR